MYKTAVDTNVNGDM